MTPHVWIVEALNEQGEWVPDFSMIPNDAAACQTKEEALAWCEVYQQHTGGPCRYRTAKYVREEAGE